MVLKTMNKWIELLLGLILLVGTIYVAWATPFLGNLGAAAMQFLKGAAVWLVMLLGILFIILGINDLKD
jgi:hypothetical protein